MLFKELQCDSEQMDTVCDPSYSCVPDLPDYPYYCAPEVNEN